MWRLSEQSKKDLEKLRVDLGDISFPSKGWRIYTREMNKAQLRDMPIWHLLFCFAMGAIAAYELWRWYSAGEIEGCDRSSCFLLTHESRPNVFDFFAAINLSACFLFGVGSIFVIYYKLTSQNKSPTFVIARNDEK